MVNKTVGIIPAYNEEKNIAAVLDVVKEAKNRGLLNEIIVVSDGSTDRTDKIAESRHPDRLLRLDKNKGKAFAVVEGLKNTNASEILLLDADLINLSVSHIEQILTPLKKKQADMVVGYLSDDLNQVFLPYFSGQRALTRQVADYIVADRTIARSGYNFEILLNRLARKKKSRVIYKPLEGLSHLAKGHKYSPLRVLFSRFRFLFGMTLIYKRIVILLCCVVLAYLAYLTFRGPLSEYYSLLSSQSANVEGENVGLLSAVRITKS